jgi:DeoR/GlpR family transcriptional regulator of sugar metabolism
MGIGGISEAGFSNSNTLVVGPERKMIDAAKRVIVVADHTKFGRGSVTPLAPLGVVDVVISDSGLALEYQELLRSQDVQVLLA